MCRSSTTLISSNGDRATSFRYWCSSSGDEPPGYTYRAMKVETVRLRRMASASRYTEPPGLINSAYLRIVRR